MVGKGYKSISNLIILLIICGIIGSFAGDLLKPYIPGLLSKNFNIGFGPLPINLKILSLTLGFSLNLNLFSMIGLVIALIIYFRL
ncbi:MAG: DUF4321 domain-containing protein [Clostridiales bacterium]|mgnify:CR=1 FL=1|nr:DUF4321 domain-containing protein [Clostridiales bacterium]HBM79457.1 DUF4321 domain-containing protein [Clostridiaceae bacterium]